MKLTRRLFFGIPLAIKAALETAPPASPWPGPAVNPDALFDAVTEAMNQHARWVRSVVSREMYQ